MYIIKKFSMAFFISNVFLGTSMTPTVSQEKTPSDIRNMTYQEQFDGDDTSIMLGGQINFSDPKSKWLVYVGSGKLVMENRLDPSSLHYDDIEWIRYPGSEFLSSTGKSEISVTVEAKNEGRGGAGIIVGSGGSRNYWMFGVDSEGRYHILNKGSRRLNFIHSAKHNAILIGKPNRLSFGKRGDNIAFFANGIELIKIPNGDQKLNSRRQINQSGIGLAAFGLGSFTFDDIEIAQSN